METLPNEFSGPVRIRGRIYRFGSSIASLTQLSSEAQWHASSFLPSFPLPFRPFLLSSLSFSLSLSFLSSFFFITRQINDRGWKSPWNKRPISKVSVPLDPRPVHSRDPRQPVFDSEIVRHRGRSLANSCLSTGEREEERERQAWPSVFRTSRERKEVGIQGASVFF